MNTISPLTYFDISQNLGEIIADIGRDTPELATLVHNTHRSWWVRTAAARAIRIRNAQEATR